MTGPHFRVALKPHFRVEGPRFCAAGPRFRAALGPGFHEALVLLRGSSWRMQLGLREPQVLLDESRGTGSCEKTGEDVLSPVLI